MNVHSTQTPRQQRTTHNPWFDAYAKEQTPEQYRAVHYETSSNPSPPTRHSKAQPDWSVACHEGPWRRPGQKAEVKPLR